MKRIIVIITALLLLASGVSVWARGTRVSQPPPQWTIDANGNIVPVDQTKSVAIGTPVSTEETEFAIQENKILDAAGTEFVGYSRTYEIIDNTATTPTTGVTEYGLRAGVPMATRGINLIWGDPVSGNSVFIVDTKVYLSVSGVDYALN